MLVTSREKKLFFPLVVVFLISYWAMSHYDSYGFVISSSIAFLILLSCFCLYVINPTLICLYYKKGWDIQRILLLISICTLIVNIFFIDDFFGVFSTIFYFGMFFCFTSKDLGGDDVLILSTKNISNIVLSVFFVVFIVYDMLKGVLWSCFYLLPIIFVVFSLVYSWNIKEYGNMGSKEIEMSKVKGSKKLKKSKVKNSKKVNNLRIYRGYKWGLGPVSVIGLILIVLFGFTTFGGLGMSYSNSSHDNLFDNGDISFLYPGDWMGKNGEFNPSSDNHEFFQVEDGVFFIRIRDNQYTDLTDELNYFESDIIKSKIDNYTYTTVGGVQALDIYCTFNNHGEYVKSNILMFIKNNNTYYLNFARINESTILNDKNKILKSFKFNNS
ncbi:hypothetical protein [Methanobrevibacter filiformis]|uniref:Uncharacterized protein n=1 Tax=Methanobrevibacter filiformis TaxID=55758 RepID=A0A166A3E5_9EURY|nr:hypothetical protein [Methanobrevibacter filiformis]KZX11513.1 hypothetical protein MBFIL_14310 [Methanobrevibacter filiformis]